MSDLSPAIDNQNNNKKKKKILSHSIRIFLFIMITTLIGLAFIAYEAVRYGETVSSLTPGQSYPFSVDEMTIFSAERTDNSAPELTWKESIVGSGDVLGTIFAHNGVTSTTIRQQVVASVAPKINLEHLQPGERFSFGFNTEGQLERVIYTLPKKSPIIIAKKDNAFVRVAQTQDKQTELSFAHGVVKTSFWQAAKVAGLTDKQILDLANLFSWDIDFALDIRAGDHFEVIFENLYTNGISMGQGKILVARFTNMGKTSTSILNKNGSYYDENARDMRKTFLRAPLDFRRVSSDFSPMRRNPVTGLLRPHNGTDYAAPVGTPIWAAGDGDVIKSAFTSLNGNYIVIKHSKKFTTKYLHLQKRLVQTGDRVKQGETIGLLGATGRVTGPHLHYEFLVDGVHHNPRTVDLPLSQSLEGTEKTIFLTYAKKMITTLDQFNSFYKKTKVNKKS